MTHHLYALLVGINRYDKRSQISWLQGCTNDAGAMKTYLETRVASAKTQLHVRMLLDEQATRQAVIDGFRQHLQQAKVGDTALFYYAGHGSQDRVPEAFWPIIPSRLNETLVCYDSRTEGSWDLADKELAELIAEVGKQNPHITIVLDCCHSGSGTRGDGSAPFARRRTPVDQRDRPAESFLLSAQRLEAVEKAYGEKASSTTSVRTRGLNDSTAGWHLPQGRHVLMAACRDTEEASEYQAHGRPCGAFSHFLLDTLQKTNSLLTYRDLFNSTAAKTRASVSAQSPQLEALNLEDFDQPFLGGLVEPFPSYFTVTYDPEIGWCINGGAIQGIQPPANGETTQLALFSLDVRPEDLNDAEGAIARATVVSVEPQLSRIETDAPIETGSAYKAVITYLPVPPLNVVFEGETESIERLRQAMQSATTAGTSASYLREVSDVATAKIRVLASKSDYVVAPAAAPEERLRPITTVKHQGQSLEDPVSSADSLIRLLAHIARWTNVSELTPPLSNQLPANAVELQIYYDDSLVEAEFIQLVYEQQGQQWRPPSFKAKLVNRSNRSLYCTLLNLTEEYSISAPFFNSGGIWLDASSEVWVTLPATAEVVSALIPTTVPQRLWEQGVSEYQDRLKLIASTVEFDPTILLQNKIGRSGAITGAIAHRNLSPSQRGLFSQFASGAGSRDIGEVSAVETVEQWMTCQRIITTVRPQLAVEISRESDVSLVSSSGNGRAQIVIRPHQSLQANVRQTSTQSATRSMATANLSPCLREQTQPFMLTARRGLGSLVDAIELSEISRPESVTPDNPLMLIVDSPLAPSEAVLPVAYDGEFFIPLGYGRRSGEQTEIVIQHLPQVSVSTDAQTVNTRSILNALQIVFRKVAVQRLGEDLSEGLGISFEYPILTAVVKADEQKDLVRVTDSEEIRERVAQAENIAVCIHGILGSTQPMVSSLQTPCIHISGETYSVSDVYDLVLTYDYESLNTSIAVSAAQLKRKLAAVGIVPEHGKTVHVIAHSMGGLVSRWLIEKAGGAALVQHLTMLGTPNAGSPWPVVQAGLFKALGLAMNGLSTVAWPLSLIGGVLRVLESIDVALDEMNPGSDLLMLLEKSEPLIPYSIVAGNTRLIPIDEKAPLREQLERRFNDLAELPFLQEDNDMAVSVSSIRHVPTARIHIPQVYEVACNHVSYFIDPAGLAGLGWAINRAFSDAQFSSVHFSLDARGAHRGD